MTSQAGDLAGRSVRKTTQLAATLCRRARGRGAQASCGLLSASSAPPSARRKVVAQIQKRVSGQKITERLVSMSDPDARRIHKGKLPSPPSSAPPFRSPSCASTRAGAPADW